MTMVEEVAEVLDAAPGQTAAEVRDALRSRGRASLTTADVVRVLTTYARRFSDDGGEPPRWWPEGAAIGKAPATGRAADAPRVDSWRGPQLYAWQREALDAWRERAGRGVIEAVTGTGKTMVGIAAACEELATGGQVCVLVPTRELLSQWRRELARHVPSHTSVGLLGDGNRDRLGQHDILVAVVNSARLADLAPRRPGGLLVADECHRYGSDGNRVALETRFARRLGLSATYARSDDGHLAWLDPYFGGTCFRMGYRRAIADGVTARFRVALMGVRFDPGERADYDELTETMSVAKAQLVTRGGVEPEPVGAFFAAVSRLARSGEDGPIVAAARRYLRAMQDRRALLAETPAKTAALAGLSPALRAADRAIVFTQSIAAAERAAGTLLDSGLRAAAVHSGQRGDARRAVLAGFAAGDVQAVAAPQVLDEGIDVPAADLAVILAASRSRRQMVQRMGRVLRRKPDGRLARFVVVSVEGTVEDPAHGAHEGFLDEIITVADSLRSLPPGAAAEVCAFVDPGQVTDRTGSDAEVQT
jgi:RNA polymerase primary sigma factor